MHGPGVDPTGQPLIVIKHRATDEKLDLVLRVLSCFNSNIAQLTADEHDRITADTQAVTHAAFLTMGSAWKANAQFPASKMNTIIYICYTHLILYNSGYCLILWVVLKMSRSMWHYVFTVTNGTCTPALPL